MNRAQRILYGQKNERRLKLFARQFTRRVYTIIHGEMKGAADVLRRKGPGFVRDQIDTTVVLQGLGKLVGTIYTTVGLYYLRRTLREINASIKDRKQEKAVSFSDQQWINLIIEYLRLHLLTKAIIPITAETKKQILSILDKGENEGWSIDKMAFMLASPELSLWRARLITRTEILKAQFTGQQLGEQESEYETVGEWVSAHEHRVRHSHKKVDGTVLPQGERYVVERWQGKNFKGYDMMLGPGDVDASPENTIQCRCIRAVRAKRDKDGKVVIKKVDNTKINLPLPV